MSKVEGTRDRKRHSSEVGSAYHSRSFVHACTHTRRAGALIHPSLPAVAVSPTYNSQLIKSLISCLPYSYRWSAVGSANQQRPLDTQVKGPAHWHAIGWLLVARGRGQVSDNFIQELGPGRARFLLMRWCAGQIGSSSGCWRQSLWKRKKVIKEKSE